MTEGRRKPVSGAENGSTVASDEALKRTLERDTAVQGEREEDTETTPRHPAGTDTARPTARPSGDARSRKAK